MPDPRYPFTRVPGVRPHAEPAVAQASVPRTRAVPARSVLVVKYHRASGLRQRRQRRDWSVRHRHCIRLAGPERRRSSRVGGISLARFGSVVGARERDGDRARLCRLERPSCWLIMDQAHLSFDQVFVGPPACREGQGRTCPVRPRDACIDLDVPGTHRPRLDGDIEDLAQPRTIGSGDRNLAERWGCGGRSGTHRHRLLPGWGAERSRVQISPPRLGESPLRKRAFAPRVISAPRRVAGLRMTGLLLAAAFVLIIGGAILFTNAIEWSGKRLDLGEGAVGSLLAAVGTALPESLIPVVAVLAGGESEQVAIGAIVGAPFMLGTVAMLLVGASALAFRRRRASGSEVTADDRSLRRDLRFFLPCFATGIGLGLIDSTSIHTAGAVGLLIAYGAYARRTVRHSGESEDADELKPLTFDPSKEDPPRNIAIVAQLVVGLLMIVAGAELFVEEVVTVAEALGISALVLSLVLAPLATELQ